jgi:hypothetical protein
MSRRLAAVALALLASALAPSAAGAQAPADARALADIGIRATAEIDAVIAGMPGDLGEAPTCAATTRLLRRGTQRQIDAAGTLAEAQWIARFARRAEPVIARAAADMQAVPTSDPALSSGRTAWRRIDHAYLRFGALKPVHFCSELREYVRGDFRATHAMRVARRMYDRANNWDTSDIDRRLDGAVERLVALGVPPADADAFDGEIG